MNNYEIKIKDAFNSSAWAYAVMYHGVAIGLWDGENSNLYFHPTAGFSWDYVSELRVFDQSRELRFVRDENDNLCFRDSKGLEESISSSDKHDTSYLMYGTDITPEESNGTRWSVLTEDRGGRLYFPKELSFTGPILMWLNIRNYMQVVKSPTGSVRLEVCDYAFTGFGKGTDKKGVELNA